MDDMNPNEDQDATADPSATDGDTDKTAVTPMPGSDTMNDEDSDETDSESSLQDSTAAPATDEE